MKCSGGCQCGNVRYVAEVDNFDAYLCHCRMCQRASGNVSVAFKNVPRANVTWQGEPDWYASSPIAERGFCRHCGTPLAFRYRQGENIDLTVGSFDDPSPFVPVSNFGIESRHPAWENTADLPGQRVDEYAPLVERWLTSVGKLPD